MRKQVRKLSLHRETLYWLDATSLLKARGGDNKPPFTMTLAPSAHPDDTCGCPHSTMCDSVVIC